MHRALTTAQTLLAEQEDGASLTEYALLVSLIAVAVIIAVAFLGGKLEETYSTVANSI